MAQEARAGRASILDGGRIGRAGGHRAGGDSTVDLETARNAGVRICLARYGFGFADLAPDVLRGDELIVDQPREIAEAVR